MVTTGPIKVECSEQDQPIRIIFAPNRGYLSPQQPHQAKNQGHLDLSFHSKPSLTSNPLNQLYRHHPSASIDYRTVTPHGRRISQPTLYCSTNKQAAVASPQSCPSSGIPSVAPRTLRAPSSRNPSLVAMSLPRAQLTSRSRLNTS